LSSQWDSDGGAIDTRTRPGVGRHKAPYRIGRSPGSGHLQIG
jgi:hypothetical protein